MDRITARCIGCKKGLLIGYRTLGTDSRAYWGELSHARRKGLRHLFNRSLRRDRQRVDGARSIDMNDGVKLLRDPRLKVVAPALRFRPVDHADSTLQQFFGQRTRLEDYIIAAPRAMQEL